MIPDELRNLSPEWPIDDEAVRAVFESMIQDGSWGRYHGPHCEQFRLELAEYHQVNHVVLCSSGTCAVELALRAANVQHGDEVILAAYDYKANFSNVIALGAIPVLIDTMPRRPVPDVGLVRDALSDRTKAIVCSHLHGSLVDINAIKNAVGDQAVVIEDSCQSPGATIDTRRAGSIGDLGVLSFGGSKLLTAGRGGAVLTDDPQLAQRIRLYTQRGNDAYPLSEMQAAVLIPQLQRLDERNLRRLASVKKLRDHLAGSELSVVGSLDNPDQPAFYKMAIGWEGEITRDDFAARVRARGVAVDPAFPALHRIHASRRFRTSGDLPNADWLHEHLLTLHHPVLLKSDEVIAAVGHVLSDVAANG